MSQGRGHVLKFIIHNLLGRRIWLTFREDIFNDVIYVNLHPKEPPMHPSIELYENLINNQNLKLTYLLVGPPWWTESTKIIFTDTDFDVKPHRHPSTQSDADGLVRIYTLKLTNGVH